MPTIRVMILRAAGTNCDLECEHAWRLAGAAPERVHVRRLIENRRQLDDFQVLTIPGGFSYGDDISAGRIFAAQLERHLLDDLRRFVAGGRLILGICNGFQVLVKAGLLPFSQGAAGPRPANRPAERGRAPAPAGLDVRSGPIAERVCTLTYNDPPGFQDRWVWLRADSAKCVFLEPQRVYEMPIAHGEGRVLFRDAAALETVLRNDQCALRYVPPPDSGDTTVTVGTDVELAASVALTGGAVARSAAAPPFAAPSAAAPYNPNGSAADLAGLCDETGRVLGLMPHPDRFTDWTQHPCWTSLPPRPEGDGLALFRRAVAYLD